MQKTQQSKIPKSAKVKAWAVILSAAVALLLMAGVAVAQAPAGCAALGKTCACFDQRGARLEVHPGWCIEQTRKPAEPLAVGALVEHETRLVIDPGRERYAADAKPPGHRQLVDTAGRIAASR